jgi:hypothetical protein
LYQKSIYTQLNEFLNIIFPLQIIPNVWAKHYSNEAPIAGAVYQ